MLGRASKGRCESTPTTGPDAATLVSRVRVRLDAIGGFGHLHVRSYGQHILLETRPVDHPRDRDAIARLTQLGTDAFGLSFRRPNGGWDPIVLVDALEEMVDLMTAALELEPALCSDAA
jgi:hypothetical protein